MALADSQLSEIVLHRLADSTATAVAAVPALSTLLRDGLAAARAAWPDLAVSDERFLAQIAAAITRPEHATLLATLRFADLYLAAACAAGDPRAAHALTVRYRPDLEAALRQLDLRPAQVDDILQAVWHVLLVGADGRPRIGGYRGHSQLRRWLRSTALRVAYKVLVKSGRELALDDDHLDGLPTADIDPEVDYLKRRYAAEFRLAFHAAVAALSPRERALLRRHHLDGLSVDDLGRLYGVSRATAHRWVADARKAVLRHLRRNLGERLRLSATDLTSMVGLIESRLDLSLERVLAGSG